jgi:release factor glutamine methyltransferase
MKSDPLTVLEVIKKTTDFFAGKGIEHARLNAELLVGHGLGLKRMQLYLQFERVLMPVELEKIRPMVRRRGQREPLQYIVGETEFSGLVLKVDRRALIPRPETELLIELIAARHQEPPKTILDLGTGSGAICLALAKLYPESSVIGVDTSEEALALAGENAVKNQLEQRVSFLRSSWFSGVEPSARFDLVVANPPYLSLEETAEATPEVRDFEPKQALTPTSGDDRSDLRTIIAEAPSYLTVGGWLALETGIGQHAELVPLVKAAGFIEVESLLDLTGRDRFILAKLG